MTTDSRLEIRRRLLERYGTMVEAGRRAGVPHRTLCRFLAGGRPSAETAAKLVLAAELPLEWALALAVEQR